MGTYKQYNRYHGETPILIETDTAYESSLDRLRVYNAGFPLAMSASGIAKTGSGVLLRIVCCASSSLVVNVYDGTSTGGTKIFDTLTLSAGVPVEMGVTVASGIYVEIASGSGKWTVSYL